jgi:hypothetical protein
MKNNPRHHQKLFSPARPTALREAGAHMGMIAQPLAVAIANA